ncbi:MAG: sulfatase-like hydrolase/transferase, partial [Planctomycetes bacterium]|nr:sulfatase-like hydrolase/transferase [Planctomycetota bacterium]
MRTAITLLAFLAACHRPPHPGTPPLHVLLVTVEQMRADRLSCYQHRSPTSAFDSTLEERIEGRAFGLDELARGGVLFDHAFAPSSALGPALAALHTGRSPIETGVLDEDGALEPRFTTLAAELARRGFATRACVTGTGDRIARVAGAGFESFAAESDDARTLEAARTFFDRDSGSGRSTFLWIHLAGPALPWDAPLAPEDGRRFVDPSYAGAADGSSVFLARLARAELALDEADRAALGARYDERLRATLERL